MSYPDSMVQLIELFARFPGVGKRTAERFAMYVLSARHEEVESLSKILLKVNENIHSCQECFNLSEENICHICSDPTRDHGVLCVVQDPKDVIAVEKSGDYSGVYHVLMGALSPLEGIGPKDIRVKELLHRLKNGHFREVVLATTSDTEGDATAVYLTKQLKTHKIKVTRIAHGVPVGSSLEFVDKASLSRAFKYRQDV
jgi:recombination protein RecR